MKEGATLTVCVPMGAINNSDDLNFEINLVDVTRVEPINSQASTTPGMNSVIFLCSLNSDPETAAPILYPPFSGIISLIPGIFFISTIKSGSIIPDFI